MFYNIKETIWIKETLLSSKIQVKFAQKFAPIPVRFQPLNQVRGQIAGLV